MLRSLQQGAPSTGLCRGVTARKAGWPTEVPADRDPAALALGVQCPCGHAGRQVCVYTGCQGWAQACLLGAGVSQWSHPSSQGVEKFQGLRWGGGPVGKRV